MIKLILLSLLLVACDNRHMSKEMDCPSPTTTEHRVWLLDCIEKGNPLSDEEGEDLVKQCEWTAERMFCLSVPSVRVTSFGNRGYTISCKKAVYQSDIEFCELNGYDETHQSTEAPADKAE